MHAHDHGHSDHHGHHHPDPTAPDGAGVASLARVLWLNLLFLAVEVSVATWTGSLALLADAVHMGSDVLAIAAAWAAARIADPSATPGRAFGTCRAPALAAFGNGLTLALASVWIAAEAAHRAWSGVGPTAATGILAVGVLGLVINLGSAWVLSRSQSDDVNVRAALWHMLADALGSIAAIAAAIGVSWGAMWTDAAASAVVAAAVGWGSWSVVRESSLILLDFDDAHAHARAMAAVKAVPGVSAVEDLRVWSLDGRRRVATIRVIAQTPVRDDVHAALTACGVAQVWVEVRGS